MLCSCHPSPGALAKMPVDAVGVYLQARGIPKKRYAFTKPGKTCWLLWKSSIFTNGNCLVSRLEFSSQPSSCYSRFVPNCLCCICDDSSAFLLGLSLIAIMPSSFTFTASSATNQHPVCLLYCSCIWGRRL